MAMRRALAVAARPLHTSSGARAALPALSDDAPQRGGLLSSLFGGSAPPSLPPMTEPLPGVAAPPYTAPAKAPATQQKKLANGAIIAAEETPGATVALGIYVDSGSKYETAANAGVSHVLERLAFKATQHRSAFRITREAEVIGANLLASASREQMAYTVDVLKTHVPEAVELLADAVLHPKFELHTVNAALGALKAELAEAEASNPAAALMESLHTTAYAGGLGRPLLAPAASLGALTPDDLAEFVAANYTAPRLVLAGAGVSLEALATLAEPLLGGLPAAAAAPAPASTYVGGDARSRGAGAGVTHMALAFHFAGGWRDVRGATAMTVLQLLLGGGGSFSAGGPGKGMYSRLYTRVLNRHAWAHACTGFHSLYNDSGLVGITATCDAARAGDMADTLCAELQAVAAPGGITAAELSRAKAATIASVLMNLESRAVVAEDVGRQVLTYGERKAPSAFIADVEKLTPADMAAAAAKLLKTPPTFVASGELAGLPRYDALTKRFN